MIGDLKKPKKKNYCKNISKDIIIQKKIYLKKYLMKKDNP
jgi:hypothetical protein